MTKQLKIVLYSIVGLLVLCIAGIIVQLVVMNKKFNSMKEEVERLSMNQSAMGELLFNELQTIKTTSNSQFAETKKISSNYDRMLEEEKKARVDTTGMETENKRIEKEGDTLFAGKRYSDAYKKYVQVLAVNPENKAAREKKIRSLYYSNPMNSSNYGEILRDCAALKSGGGMTLEIEKIEKAVLEEKGQLAQAGDKTND